MAVSITTWFPSSRVPRPSYNRKKWMLEFLDFYFFFYVQRYFVVVTCQKTSARHISHRIFCGSFRPYIHSQDRPCSCKNNNLLSTRSFFIILWTVHETAWSNDLIMNRALQCFFFVMAAGMSLIALFLFRFLLSFSTFACLFCYPPLGHT